MMAEGKGGASNIARLVTKQAGRAKEKVNFRLDSADRKVRKNPVSLKTCQNGEFATSWLKIGTSVARYRSIVGVHNSVYAGSYSFLPSSTHVCDATHTRSWSISPSATCECPNMIISLKVLEKSHARKKKLERVGTSLKTVMQKIVAHTCCCCCLILSWPVSIFPTSCPDFFVKWA